MSSFNPTHYVLYMTYNKHIGAKEEKMSHIENDKILETLLEEAQNQFYLKHGRHPNMTDECDYEKVYDIHSHLCEIVGFNPYFLVRS